MIGFGCFSRKASFCGFNHLTRCAKFTRGKTPGIVHVPPTRRARLNRERPQISSLIMREFLELFLIKFKLFILGNKKLAAFCCFSPKRHYLIFTLTAREIKRLNYRPCYTRQFFLQLVSQQTLRDKLQERFHV